MFALKSQKEAAGSFYLVASSPETIRRRRSMPLIEVLCGRVNKISEGTKSGQLVQYEGHDKQTMLPQTFLFEFFHRKSSLRFCESFTSV